MNLQIISTENKDPTSQEDERRPSTIYAERMLTKLHKKNKKQKKDGYNK